MNKSFQFNLITAAIAGLLLSGCGDAETVIVEKETIAVEVEDDHNHDDDSFTIESMGRLAVLSAETNEAAIFDLDEGDLLDTFSLTHDDNTLTASAGFRFAVVASRSQDYVGFVDGGLWRENHDIHLHDYQQMPVINSFELSGSRPTHIVKHDDQMVLFFDGDADSGVSASVQVVKDTDISNEISEVPSLEYNINMHGVAKPQGEHLLATVRRDDTDNTSVAKILPDQVGVYHLHDNEYIQEEILDVTCPDLHGAAQNTEYVLFGCSDGVLVASQHNGEYSSEKIANIDELDSLRIGTLYSHEESDSFIGIASAHGGNTAILVSVNPEASEMEKLEWQPENNASPVSYGFSYEGEHFLILDSKGKLNILSSHEHDGEMHWELEESIDISQEDISTMPEGMRFSMAMAQNGHYVYVSDPIANHILQINLENMSIEDDIEMNFAAKSIVWLGIAEEGHDHD
ncbi:MAG: 5-methyltetrahydrofolate--homocysteine methyltransferase [Alteromonadaceae bacterium]|nr:5-methyltetrahydrofolate--homocysteine methyltransferase [Alteromonadaceae bacterium]